MLDEEEVCVGEWGWRGIDGMVILSFFLSYSLPFLRRRSRGFWEYVLFSLESCVLVVG